MSSAITSMQKVRAKMMIQQPFFATLMMSTPMIETRDIPTAATDMANLYINPDFIESLDDDLKMFVLGHEVMHIALEHGLRLGVRDPRLWNFAGDYAINLMLKEAGFKIWEHCLIDDKYEGMSADHIYEQLKKNPPQGGGSGDGKPGSGEAGGMIGDIMQPKEMSPAEEAKLKRSVQQRVAQAAQVARMAGKLKGSLERFVNEILDPKVPWSVMLREYMHRHCQDDETWSRRNRRFEVFLPTRYSEKMGEIVLIGDTSGSIGNEELTQYMSEASAIAEEVSPERIRIVWADAHVAGEQLFEEGEPIVPKPQGGGGTDMRVPLKHVEQYNPEVVVLFTDGYTPWPTTEPDFPLIVCCTTETDCPIGQVVRI